ncbi:unnamed protein product [Adineta steineri]|uniref:Uncharacterized protein n=1 Tax=Adineta steineri TaxID=433720 RepID=A0A819ZFK0_9BILA|nr:unnamed protein product [Adineta steineri]
MSYPPTAKMLPFGNIRPERRYSYIWFIFLVEDIHICERDFNSKICICLIDIFSKRYSYVGIGFSCKDIRMSGFNFRSMIFIHLDFLFDQRHSSTWISRLLIDIHPLVLLVEFRKSLAKRTSYR